jgi:hypothetical protein
MAELHPTKTRLRLLQAVADGAVTWHWALTYRRRSYACVDLVGAGWDRPSASPRWRVVTARVEELSRAGWVAIKSTPGLAPAAPTEMELTPAGQTVLYLHGSDYVG